MELVVVRSAASPTRPRRVSLPAVVRPLAAAALVVAEAELGRMLVAVAEVVEKRLGFLDPAGGEPLDERGAAVEFRLEAEAFVEADAADLGVGVLLGRQVAAVEPVVDRLDEPQLLIQRDVAREFIPEVPLSPTSR